MSLEAHLEILVQSKGFKRLLARLYGWGASVVVLGALFKLEHWTGADYMLSAGLITEAVIFFFYAFDKEEEPPHPVVSYTAEVVEEAENGSKELPSAKDNRLGTGNGSLALARFDEMLENAEITPELLVKFGEGLRKLGDTTENMNSMEDVFSTSRSYLKTLRSADESLGKLAKAYENTITNVTCKTVFKYQSLTTSLSLIEEESRTYQQQMELLNKNLTALNNVYKLQRKGADDFLKDMAESAAEAKKYREQMKELNKNLTELNKFYGNMRSAISNKF
ncbi:MAG: gliding motility protein GldL [Bacteroidota bacterium]|nr:gliding motility protein GldL [Bacteroidota bacterium]